MDSTLSAHDTLDVDESKLRYVSDAGGRPTAVIVPIDVWRELSSWAETGYLLGHEAMRERLLASTRATERIPYEEVKRRLGLTEADEACE